MITVAMSNTCKDDMESCKSAVYWKNIYINGYAKLRENNKERYESETKS